MAEHLLEAVITILLTQATAGIAWILRDNINLKVKQAKMETDLDAAHAAIRDLKGIKS